MNITQKGLTWWKAINEHTDLTDEEFNNYYNLKPKTHEEMKSFFAGTEKFLEKQIDFDEMADKEDNQNQEESNVTKVDISYGATLSPVRNQGGCGSCWAHATTCSIESAWGYKNYPTKSPWLSVQQLVDCDNYSGGCSGGWMPYALKYLINNGGIVYETDYPYTYQKGTCSTDKSRIRVKVQAYDSCDSAGWFSQEKCTKEKWKGILARGAVSVVISTGDAFRDYGGGIIQVSGSQCAQLTHAVTAYAWTTEDSGREYISVRNSWGEDWGDKGDFHIYYTDQANSTCWVTKMAFRPILA